GTQDIQPRTIRSGCDRTVAPTDEFFVSDRGHAHGKHGPIIALVAIALIAWRNLIMHKNMIYAMVALALVVVSTAAMADNDEFDCNTVRFGIVSWPAVTIKTKAAKWMLEKLGYNSTITTA